MLYNNIVAFRKFALMPKNDIAIIPDFEYN